MAGSDATPPGWYRQPDDPDTLRWWDGDDWTDDEMPAPTGAGDAVARSADHGPARTADRSAPSERPSRAQASRPLRQAPAEPIPLDRPQASTATDRRQTSTAADRSRAGKGAGRRQASADADRARAGTGAGRRQASAAAERSRAGTAAADRGGESERADRSRASAVAADRGGEGERTDRSRASAVAADRGGEGGRTDRAANESRAPQTHHLPDRRQAPPAAAPRRGATRSPARTTVADHYRQATSALERPAPARSGPSRPGADRRREPAGGPRRPTNPTRPGGGERSSRVVASGPRPVPLGVRFAVRALLLLVVAGILFFGYTQLRDAEPGRARTLGAATETTEPDPEAAPLSELVVSLNDLPNGWATQPYDPATDDICDGRLPQSVLVPVDTASSSFNRGTSGPFLTNVITRHPSERVAERYLDLVADTLDACRTHGPEGTQIVLESMSFPTFGDDTFVVRVTGQSPVGALKGTIVYLRVGDRVASIETLALDVPDVDIELVELLAQVVSRRI